MGNVLAKVRLCLLLVLLCLGSLFGCHLVFGDVEIGDPPPDGPATPAECENGEFRCYQENLLACGGDKVGWVASSICVTSDFCDSGNKRCRVCKSGDRRCNGATREQCNLDGSGWETLDTCGSPETCSPASCGPCNPDDVQCGGADLSVLRQCNASSVWEDVEDCASARLCADSLASIKTNPDAPKACLAPCDPVNPYACDGIRLRRCGNEGAWLKVDDCANNALCEKSATEGNAKASSGAPPLEKCLTGCQGAGTYFCNGMTLQRCSDDLTEYETVTTCEPPLECNPMDGQCTPRCTPGTHQCNGVELRRCREDQIWEVLEKCANAASCRLDPPRCEMPPCPVAGEFQCSGAVLERCSEDLQWLPHSTCASEALCNEKDKRCDPYVCPVAGEFQCFPDKELRQCNDDLTAWIFPNGRTEPLICGAGEFCDSSPTDPGCKTECPAPTGCNGADHQTCSPEGWKTDATCGTAELCKCTLSDPDGAGPRTNACEGGLDTTGKCGKEVCRVSGDYREYRCSGTKLQRCLATQNGWEDVATCESADLCVAGDFQQRVAGFCAVCTKPFDLQCRNGYTPGSPLSQCTGDRTRWMTIQTCGLGCVENMYADYCALCNSGDAQCSGQNLLRCASDRRGFETEVCASAQLCDLPNKQCDRCAANSVTCSGKELRKCSANGQNLTTQTCANVCDAAAGQCDACAAGTAWCDGTTLYRCSADGQMQTGETCPTADLCNAGAKRCDMPACAVGDRRCTATGQPQVCNAGRTAFTNDGIACVTPQLCRNGACTPPVCAVGEKQCDMAQPQICNAGRTGFVDTTDAPCATAQLCTLGTCSAPRCAVGARRCSPDAAARPQVCNAGRTDYENDGPACAAMQTCLAGACVDVICTPAERRCNMTQPQVCNASGTAWTNSGAACGATEVCVAGACADVICTPAERRCNMTQPQVCNANGTAWTNSGTACGATEVCVAGACADLVCATGELQCNGAQPQVCNATRTGWTNSGAACTAAQMCMAGVCVTTPVCTPGAVRCSGAGMTTLEKCAADGLAWTGTACTGTTPICNPMPPGSCDECAVSTTPTCAPGTPSTAIRTCPAGTFVDTACPGMQVCTDGTCDPATPPPASP